MPKRICLPICLPALMVSIGIAARAQITRLDASPQLRLAIDAPAEDATPIRARVTFSGWAIDSAAVITDVSVSVDGAPVGTADYGASRPDVCAIYSNVPGCPDVGWTFTLDTGALARGTHTLSVQATSGAGNQTTVKRQFTTVATAEGELRAMDSSTAPADFQLSVTPSTLSILTGNSGIATVQVAATGSFDGTVTFTCSESSELTAASCEIPGVVAASGTATLIVMASSTLQSAALHHIRTFPGGGGPLLVSAIAFCCFAYLLLQLPSRKRAQFATIAMLIAVTIPLTSCDEQGGSSTTPATMSVQPASQTGTVTVTATSGTLSHAVTVSVTVNQNTNATPLLTQEDVTSVVQHAAEAINSVGAVISVTDRLGNVLGVFKNPQAPASSVGNFGNTVPTDDLAVALARTASFFSNDQAPLSSRTVRYISGIHFPPGVMYTPNAALYGIENTNRGCALADSSAFVPGKSIPPATSLSGGTGLGIITGKPNLIDQTNGINDNPADVNPGGVPLFKAGSLVGGVGVAGVDGPTAEYAAFSGAVGAGFGPTPAPPGVVVVNGISLPLVDQTTPPAGIQAGAFNGTWSVSATGSSGPPPEGYLIGPNAGPLGGLSQSDVQGIVNAAVATANATRAVIRLPDGVRARFMIAVADLDGTLIALYRMHDATIFSIDVAVAKSRNVIYFSGPNRQPSDLPGVPMGTAVTNRTISFGAQPLFPPGIDGTAPGPFFPLYLFDTANPCTQGQDPRPANKNGVVFFPGSAPLYRSGVLVGGLGISGDGVDQDDFVANAGAAAFPAPAGIRADQVTIDGVRLPYQKFPRNPTN